MLRNFHGRMLEENMVEFTPELFDFPNKKCFVENINFGTSTFQEETCQSELSEISATETGIHPLYFSLDEESTAQGAWLSQVMKLPNPITTIMFSQYISGGTGLTNIPNYEFSYDESFYIIQRRDKSCVSRLGTIEISAWYGMGVNIDERYVDNIENDAFLEGLIAGLLLGGLDFEEDLIMIPVAVYFFEEMALRNVNI